MTRSTYEQLAQEYLEELLTGNFETSCDVASEVREIDEYFIPVIPPPKDSKILGLLGQMAATTSIYETFRNPPQPLEILDCQAKLNFVISQQKRKAKRENTSYSETECPFLWILCPSCSDRLIEGFGAKPDSSGKWPTGVYFWPEFQNTGLVAINELPIDRDTLWLRVLGKDRTQEQAFLELIALPKSHPLQENVIEFLASWYVKIRFRANENIDEDDRELSTRKSPVFLRLREEILEQGRRAGRQKGFRESFRESSPKNFREVEQNIREIIKSSFNFRFGSLNSELLAIIEPMLLLSPKELARLLLNASREELLERFGK
ncbi:MAG: hypothetical protein F6K39_04650 [Okeania sp. SIO3B3]|nr:hypothetical protein [Okeania sp. SIO3B3]